MIFISDEEDLPADLVILTSGDVYVKTSSLDGEKNLKKKSCPKGFKYND